MYGPGVGEATEREAASLWKMEAEPGVWGSLRRVKELRVRLGEECGAW